MFTTIRKIVTRSAILPGIIWTGIKNPINEMMRSIIQGKYVFIIIGAKRLFSENLKPATETLRFLGILSNMVSLMNSSKCNSKLEILSVAFNSTSKVSFLKFWKTIAIKTKW